MAKAQESTIGDDELVLGSLLGDLEAFDVLVRRYRSAVTSVAQQVVGSRDVAEEVAQESFLAAFRELPQLARVECFAGWLCAIARHRARRVAAREGRSEPQEPSALDLIVMASSPSLCAHPADEVARQAEHSEVAQALSQLPPEHQIVLRLRYYEEWSVSQIAHFLALPSTTVKWRLHHGRELMRRQLTTTTEENEENHEQRAEQHRHPATARRAAADRAACARSQLDGQPRQRRPQRRAAVQPHSADR